MGGFEELVERHQRPLRAFVLARVRDPGGADDIVQETFLRVYQERMDYIPMGRFRAWLYVIARNLCFDTVRRPALHGLDMDVPLILWAGLRVPPTAGTRGRDDAETERLARVTEAAEKLPPLMREVVVLKYYHDMKAREIAEVLDCPVGTVKSRLHHARRRIEAELAHQTLGNESPQ